MKEINSLRACSSIQKFDQHVHRIEKSGTVNSLNNYEKRKEHISRSHEFNVLSAIKYTVIKQTFDLSMKQTPDLKHHTHVINEKTCCLFR